ncbi:hypothetical protein [Olsenella sp. Marseille-P4559]|jgi:hypothetical protein|uniref:hypothetical protein n=1 Tax=Olsenella sp. Marseille-P4559 TaxID=2364795 RepID=UPI00102F760B|nr:hypothetical protein [Olsenella sp. Marseille-P4559]
MPDGEKKDANHPGETMVVPAIVCDFVAIASKQVIAIFACTGLLVLMTALYITGRFNSYETEKRRIRKLLKKFDQKPEFDEWAVSESSGGHPGDML